MVQSLGFEQLSGRREVPFTRANSSAPRELTQQDLVDMGVERRKLQPTVDVAEYLVASGTLHEMLQDGQVPAVKAAALGREPGMEIRAAVDFETVEELSNVQRGQRLESLRAQFLDAFPGRASDLEDVDEAVCKIQPDRVAGGLDSASAGIIEDSSELAQAPPQFAARIVRDVPEQFTETTARNGKGRESQKCKQRSYLA